MRIVIDMQGAQTESRFRGIGRYSLLFAQAVVRNRGEHEVILALSGLFPDTIESIRAAFDGLLAQENIRVWHAPGPVREVEPGNAWRRETAELIREAFLASLQPDVIHIASLFEGYIDDAVTSIGRIDRFVPVSCTIFDLIPLLNPAHYLAPNPDYARYYQCKTSWLKQASLLIAISDSSRIEAIECLGFSPGEVVNCSVGSDHRFRPQQMPDTAVAALKAKLGINRPFVLYTGGSDERKNLPRLIQAHAQLPDYLRSAHQLVLAGKMQEGDIPLLRAMAQQAGLTLGEICFTGYISDEELAQLYSICALFVFPSWHEGFGLPALEAMACGAPVIGANTTSLPEVIGLDEAMFDPLDSKAMAEKMAHALQDEGFRRRLREHGLAQAEKFSWDETARRAIAAFESQFAGRARTKDPDEFPANAHRLRLAFVSPLPPERTGIADYSAELLPALAEHYDLELVVTQAEVEDTRVNQHGRLRSVQWLREHAGEIDRVVYQVGNSPFHQHMLDLMQEIPGTLVLHDFFLSGMLAHHERNSGGPNTWVQALYAAHGYKAVQARFHEMDLEVVKRDYPCNLESLQHAQGVIVHSEYSRRLAKEWYGAVAARDWRVIPLLRMPTNDVSREVVRAAVSIAPDDFLVCSFGFLDSTKLNHRLLQAWMQSKLGRDAHCKLVFVGQNHGGEYGLNLLNVIRESGLEKRVWITGFADPALFKSYLAAADLAVQLRSSSRGETSAALLDCMNHGVATVVNANGSMAELANDAVWMLSDEFADEALVEALETLRQDAERRRAIGQRAREIINIRHAPRACAQQYAEAIEAFHNQASTGVPNLLKAIVSNETHTPNDIECRRLAKSIAKSLPLMRPAKRIFLDITATCRTELKTGIERVARALTLALIDSPPAGYRIEPVRLSNDDGQWHYRYARQYTLGLLQCPPGTLEDELVEPENGDIVLGLDSSGSDLIEAEASGLLASYRNLGVQVFFTVFDLLPVQMPEAFPPGADSLHAKWLGAVAKSDGALCISKAVADDLAAWVAREVPARLSRFKIDWFHLGADVDSSAPSIGLPNDAASIIGHLKSRPSFLMVGTIEPRKGYQQTIEAFSMLWQQGCDVNLVIVGKEGWLGLPEAARRTIPQIVQRLRAHPELGKRLFWLDGISDEYLEKIYAASTCLIAASEGEGFGLPLIEAAQHGLPIIARDIPVFHEVMQENAAYFNGASVSELASSVMAWHVKNQDNEMIMSTKIPRNTWKTAAQKLLSVIIGSQESATNIDSDLKQKAFDEHLDLIHAARVAMVSTLLPAGEIILDLGGANCPLYKMGYPHKFKRLTLIDLPPDQRHDYYKDIEVDGSSPLGPVYVRYTDMTTLEGIEDESVDFVWSGQSIEHVPLEAGERMCREAYRVLKKGGSFCLDTPNRRLTEIHTATVGGGFIHPEHCIEYTPDQLMRVLDSAGFVITNSYGVCEMPRTASSGEFHYEDFMLGKQITENVADSYIQLQCCKKIL